MVSSRVEGAEGSPGAEDSDSGSCVGLIRVSIGLSGRDGRRGEATRKAIAFYKAAFGAEEIDVMTGPDGRVMHAELKIDESMLMLGEENPAWPAFKSAETLGASPISLHLYVADADAAYAKALAAGAEVDMPLDDMFWGRTGRSPPQPRWSAELD